MPKLLYLTTQDKFFLSHLKERAVNAKDNGFTIFVAAQLTDRRYAEEIKKLGFVFFDTKIERRSLNVLSQIRAIRRLIKIINLVKPDISHHLGAKAIIFGTIAHKFANLSTRSGIVNAPIGLGYVYAANEIKAAILKPIVQFMYKLTLNPRNSRVIFENQDDLDFFVRIGALDRKKAICIYGAGVDTEVFCPSNNKNNVCTVVMASRLIKEKGVFDFVRAANVLRTKSVPVRMQLIGEPDYGNPNSLTKQQFEWLKKIDFIECLGFRDDISSLLKKAHICCLPSFYREGLPRFLIEGACCGLAIVTTDTVGCREVVINKNGFLVQPHNVDDLVDKIALLANNPMLREEMGGRSRQVALKLFDSRLVNQQTLEVYYDLLSQNSR